MFVQWTLPLMSPPCRTCEPAVLYSQEEQHRGIKRSRREGEQGTSGEDRAYVVTTGKIFRLHTGEGSS